MKESKTGKGKKEEKSSPSKSGERAKESNAGRAWKGKRKSSPSEAWEKMKKIRLSKALWRLKATACLTAALAAAYFLLSRGSLFIEKEALLSYSFSLSQPWNIFSYVFAHISVHHLAANLAQVVFFAAIVELALGAADVFLLFFFSAGLTALAFSMLNPGTGLVGASAGGAALLTSAFILDLRKTIAALAVIALLFFALPSTVAFLQELEETRLQQKVAQLEQGYEQAVQKGEEERAAGIAAEREQAEITLGQFMESKEFAIETETDSLLHVYAALFAVLYLLLFRRKKLFAAWQQLEGIRLLLKRG